MKTVNIYTDGACSGNQNDENIGGWGCVLQFGEATKELWGGEENTTNNRMEMLALISALSALKEDGLRLHIYSDSSYLINCMKQKWYVNWRKNGWKTSVKNPVENRALWEELLSFVEQNDVRFYRVKGHVDLDSPKTKVDDLYAKFLEWNGAGFSLEDFTYITKMNNRADELANQGIDEQR